VTQTATSLLTQILAAVPGRRAHDRRSRRRPVGRGRPPCQARGYTTAPPPAPSGRLRWSRVEVHAPVIGPADSLAGAGPGPFVRF